MAMAMAHPSPPPSVYPCQLRCHNCGAIFTIPPSTMSDHFLCSNCDFRRQILPIPSSNGGSPITVHGIDPYKMQVVCPHCLAILNIPPHGLVYTCTHFVCPLCHFHLPFFIFPVTLSSPPAQQPRKVFEITDDSDMKNVTSSVPTVDEEPLRSIFLLKDRKRIREFERVEDCFILEFDPYGLSSCTNLLDDHDVVLLPDQPQVACRDFPHQRYLCAKHPFNETPHDVHCKMCYCCVCDKPAPCKKWIKGDNFRHCDANVDTPICERFRNPKRRRIYPH